MEQLILIVIIFILCFLLYLSINYNKVLKCPVCKNCDKFTLVPEQEQPKEIVQPKNAVELIKNKRCRFNQDVKNIFSYFHKHHCDHSRYANINEKK